MAAVKASRDHVAPVDEAARRTLRGIAGGECLAPMLRRLLMDALVNEDRSDRPHDPGALASGAARSATEWIGASAQEREKGLLELLKLADALPPDDGPNLRAPLGSLGIDFEIDERELRRSNELPLHDQMGQVNREVPFNRGVIPLIAPEHLVIRKAILDRPKDWHDIEQILVATNPFDLQAVESWLKRMVGEDDPRIKNLAEVMTALSLS